MVIMEITINGNNDHTINGNNASDYLEDQQPEISAQSWELLEHLGGWTELG